MKSPEITPEFESLLEYLKGSRAFDFTGYKRASLARRVLKRMELLGLADYEQYKDYLEVHNGEFVHLFNTILINVTGFFRDAPAWEYIGSEILPRIIDASKGPIRIWSAGTASGEEAYTAIMLLNEALGMDAFFNRVKVFATDVDDEALNQARQASYTEKDINNVPVGLRKRYFDRSGDHYTFHKELRRAVIFGKHDLINDAPISRIDLLICRNTLMYFNTETQGRILDRFHFALNNSGFLFLGKAEMLFSRTNLFTPVDIKRRVYSKVNGGNLRRERLLVAAQAGAEIRTGTAGAPAQEEMPILEAAFDIDPVAQIVIDTDGTLVLINERARGLFGITREDLGRPLQDLELSYRPLELRSLIEQARTERKPITVRDVAWPTGVGEIRYFDVQIVLLSDNSGTHVGTKLIFGDISRYKRLQQDVEQSHQELETAYEELQSSNEEKETANEELQSTVEELETTNEELQSTNEELETMNEELQSTNEELQTMNEELRDRGTQLNEANSFLNSILASITAGVVAVDQQFNVKAWNHRAEDLWGLRSEEVQGKHFLSLDIGLPVDQLKGCIRRTFTAGAGPSEQVLEGINRRGKPLQVKVICTPMDGHDGDVQGVILLMEEVPAMAAAAVGSDGSDGSDGDAGNGSTSSAEPARAAVTPSHSPSRKTRNGGGK